MRKNLLVYALASCVVWSCSYTQGGNGSTKITLSPANGAAGQAVDVPVTATYSSNIGDPSNELNFFTLTKDNAGDNLCTSLGYDFTNHTLACSHAALDPDSSYTSLVQPRPFQEGGSTTFTTGSGVSASVTKAAWKYADDGGSIALSFKFSSPAGAAAPIPDGFAPQFSVESDDGAHIGEAKCSASEDRTRLDCTVAGIETCAECGKFKVNLAAGGISDFETTISFTEDE